MQYMISEKIKLKANTASVDLTLEIDKSRTFPLFLITGLPLGSLNYVGRLCKPNTFYLLDFLQCIKKMITTFSIQTTTTTTSFAEIIYQLISYQLSFSYRYYGNLNTSSPVFIQSNNTRYSPASSLPTGPFQPMISVHIFK